jgi:Putative beta-barrel porin-2, OmpL-like. bbp2
MSFQRKLIVVALACAMPWVSAQAQSVNDLKKEIEALKAQLQTLTNKVETMGSSQGDNSALVQQVSRIEQKQELASDDQEKSGFKGLKINGTIEAAFKYDDINRSHDFSSSAGYADEAAMLQFTKESQDGEGVDWTLRLLPGSATPVHEASLSIPLNKENRIIGGLIPDYQGYEYVFSNANPTMGNQLITHNALFDVAGPTTYAGVGMSHTFSGGTYALKWIVGNIDPANDPTDPAEFTPAANSGTKSVGFAARGDWFINEFSYLGVSFAHGSVNRNFNILAIDGGYTHGDWAFNGQLTTGTQRNAAANGDDAAWTGVSGLVSYKLTPRLQLLARADYVENRKNGGGTYAFGGGADVDGNYAGNPYGLGPERDADGVINDGTLGANLTRLSLGTNYQINANTQWKAEYRLDQSSGYNFQDVDGTYHQTKNTLATSLVLSF